MKTVLTVAAFCFALLSPTPGTAQEHSQEIALMFSSASDMGFLNGWGAAVNFRGSSKVLGYEVNARAANEKKLKADKGHTYGIQGALTFSLSHSLTAAAGITRYGYESSFQDGNRWKKDAQPPFVGLRWRNRERTGEVTGDYFFQEHDTPNRVSAFTVGGGGRVGRWNRAVGVWCSGQLELSRALQNGRFQHNLAYAVRLGIRWNSRLRPPPLQ